MDAPPSAGGAMDGERVYVPVQGGGLRAFARETGEPLWAEAVETSWAPVVGDGYIFVARPDSIAAYATSSGDERWTSLPGAVVAPPMLAGDRLIISTAGREIVALRSGDGQVLWRRALGALSRQSAALLDQDTLVLTLDDSRVVALDLQTGTPRWERTLAGTLSAPAVARDRVFVGSTNNFFYALEGRSGRHAWRWRTGGDVVGAAADEERVYFVSLDNILRAVNRNNGNQQWKTDIPTRPSAPPIVVGDVVVLAGVAPRLDGYVGKTGAALGTHLARADLQGLPLIDPALRPFSVALVVLTRDGRVTALRPTRMLFPDPPLVPLLELPGRELPPERPFSSPRPQLENLRSSAIPATETRRSLLPLWPTSH